MSPLHTEYEVDPFGEKWNKTPAYNRQSCSAPIEDVAIPAHLLRASQNLSSVRDTNPNLAHGSRGSLIVDEEKGLTGRKESLLKKGSLTDRRRNQPGSRRERTAIRNTQNAQRSDRRSVTFQSQPQFNDDRVVSSEAEDLNRKKSHHQSWLPGENEVITISRPNSAAESVFRQPGRTATHDPFSTSHNLNQSSSSSVWSDDSFDAQPNSRDGKKKSYKEPEVTYTPAGQRKRRGTLGSVVEAVVPDVLAKRLTNASLHGLQRKGSVWKTYENAKKRGVELQRKKWVQILFEYGIYVFLLCFIYFVLIGRPLWNGAVWWLYWVVENKFVIAGGFAITLGIALL